MVLVDSMGGCMDRLSNWILLICAILLVEMGLFGLFHQFLLHRTRKEVKLDCINKEDDLAKNITEALTPGTDRHETLVLLLALNEARSHGRETPTDEDIKAVLDRFEEARNNTCLGSDCHWHEWLELRNEGNIYIEREHGGVEASK